MFYTVDKLYIPKDLESIFEYFYLTVDGVSNDCMGVFEDEEKAIKLVKYLIKTNVQLDVFYYVSGPFDTIIFDPSIEPNKIKSDRKLKKQLIVPHSPIVEIPPAESSNKNKLISSLTLNRIPSWKEEKNDVTSPLSR